MLLLIPFSPAAQTTQGRPDTDRSEQISQRTSSNKLRHCTHWTALFKAAVTTYLPPQEQNRSGFKIPHIRISRSRYAILVLLYLCNLCSIVQSHFLNLTASTLYCITRFESSSEHYWITFSPLKVDAKKMQSVPRVLTLKL